MFKWTGMTMTHTRVNPGDSGRYQELSMTYSPKCFSKPAFWSQVSLENWIPYPRDPHRNWYPKDSEKP